MPPASTPPLSPPEEARAALARDRIRQRRARENCFGAEFFSDPCWDIMLDLYAAHYEGEPVSISSLCIAASAPATTATRWIDRMTEKGLLTRSKDPADGRRIYIHLSKDTRLKLDAYFEALQQN
ncbi:hypothetical protein ADT71_10535 [Novosphingobium sp. ST904]|nr:hypothetical protein ADT71_10535 [Novosphingobium sp. ST904]